MQGPELIWLIGGAIALIVIAVLIVAHQRTLRRREACRMAALEMGLEYRQELPELVASLAGAKLFSRGRRHRVFNAMVGDRGATRVALGDLRYVTGSGRNQSVHNESFCVLRVPGLVLPPFFVRAQIPLLDAIGRMFGGQDIDFDEDQEFSRAFILQGEDEAATRALFSAPVRHHLMQFARRAIRVEGRSDTLILVHLNLARPSELSALLTETTALLEVLSAERTTSSW